MPSLVVRSETLRQFAAAQTARANDDLDRYLRQRFPDLLGARSEGEVLDLVQTVRIKAKLFGIEREDNVATFLDLTIMYPRFPDAAWSRDILASDKLNGPDKMALLRDRVRRHNTEL